MTYNLVIACIDTRNPPQHLAALDGLDIQVHSIIGFDNPAEAELYREADGIITEMHPVTGPMMDTFKRCRIVACASTGYDYVDLAAATAHNIWVTNCPGYCTDEVATHTLALILSQARRLPQARALARAQQWDPRPVRPLPHVRRQTLGVIGWGRIGKAVAAKAQALGFNVLANDPYIDPQHMLAAGVTPADKETIARTADYVSLHTPLTDETRGMLNAHLFGLMKPTAYVVNTARGLLVNEGDLLKAVQTEQIAGAALDVLSVEPPPPDHPFLHDDRFIVTPHCAWCSEEADQAVWEWAAGYVANVLRGERPAGAVNELKGS